MRLANLKIMSAKHNYDTEELDTGCTGRKPHAKEELVWIFEWKQLWEVKGLFSQQVCLLFLYSQTTPKQC